jgi:predicted O-methyltransferase YrrM
MAIRDEQLDRYLTGLRPERSPVMAEMEAVGERDHVPIVSWETGRLLATLCRALDPNVLEVGTAIGYSALHMAEQLAEGRVTSLEIDPDRAARAQTSFERAGVADRVDVIVGDARETLPPLAGPFDLLFVDAVKSDYRWYVEVATPKLAPGALLVVDNLLMSGEVAAAEGDETSWKPESLASARELNVELTNGDTWLGSVLPVGDGVGLATLKR